MNRTFRPDLTFLFSHPAHTIACGLGSGLSYIAPGTVGTLFAWFLYLLFGDFFSEDYLAIFLGVALVVGFFVCHRTGKDLGVVDHGSIVWDEMVAFWLILIVIPNHWIWQTAGFFLFRFFDVFKPPVASWFDERVKNGFGVMMDDVIAACYALFFLALWKRVFL